MPHNADTLLDRLYLKSQVTRWRLLALVFALAATIIVIEHYTHRSPIDTNFIARLTFDGIIGDDQKIYDMVEKVRDNGRAKAVIVWLNTPGGSAVGGEELYARLRELSAKKPVVAVMRSVAASAGYMVALGADHIVAREGTITGSIGVLVETAEFTDMADKLGINPIVIKSAPLKGSPNPLEEVTPEARQMVKEVIDDFYRYFVDIVSERRGLPRETVVKLADGRVYSGREAVEIKLIDALGGEEEALKWLAEKRRIGPGIDIRDVKPEEQIPWMDAISQSLSRKFFQNSSIMLDGLAAIWHPQL